MENVEVAVNHGRILGRVVTGYKDVRYVSFQGIPYAKPPLGALRFKAPEPMEPWSGVRDATKPGNDCFQRDFITDEIVGSEDCLYLNVYTPSLPSEKPRSLYPVMVYIHGGSFTSGSGHPNRHGPDFLVAQDVILVTFNYRLGLLGVIWFEDANLGASGNTTFKDMALALQWVQENIENFNGNPANITIFGASAGACAVQCLMLSPLSKGLFQKAIMQSGSALSPWSKARNCLHELCNILNIDTMDAATILDILQKLDVKKLFNAQEKLRDIENLTQMRPYGYIIEQKSTNGAFLTEEPIEIMKSGQCSQIPLIIGYTDCEGMLLELMSKKNGAEFTAPEKFQTFIPWFIRNRDMNLLETVDEMIGEFYSLKPAGDGALSDLYNLFTDTWILRGIYSSIRNFQPTLKNPIYLYRFVLDTKLNFWKPLLETSSKGACHCDENGYLFYSNRTPTIEESSVEDIGQQRMALLWTNFAKESNPTPTLNPLLGAMWTPVSPIEEFDAQVPCLEIGDALDLDINPDWGRMHFWDTIFHMFDSNTDY